MRNSIFLFSLLGPYIAAAQAVFVDLGPGTDVKTVNGTASILNAAEVYGEFVVFIYGEGFVTGLRYGVDPKASPAVLAQNKQDAITKACTDAIEQKMPIQQIFTYYPNANNALAEPIPTGAGPEFDPANYLEQQIVQCTQAPEAAVGPVNMLYSAPNGAGSSVMKYSFTVNVGGGQPAMQQIISSA